MWKLHNPLSAAARLALTTLRSRLIGEIVGLLAY
jgi:hypothetical protein